MSHESYLNERMRLMLLECPMNAEYKALLGTPSLHCFPNLSATSNLLLIVTPLFPLWRLSLLQMAGENVLWGALEQQSPQQMQETSYSA